MSTRVAVIGPGRAGTAMALALPTARYDVVAVAGRGQASLERFAERIPSAAPRAPAEAARGADLVLLTVPDDALVPTVRSLARHDAVTEGSRWVHCSPGHGVAALRPAALAGARAAACHPALGLPAAEGGAERLAGAAWAVTAEESDRGWAAELVADLGGTPHLVPERSRPLYDAALTVGSDGVSAVVSLARDLLLGAGVDLPEAFLEPLVAASAAGASGGGAATLAGPTRLGEAEAVSAHLAHLDVDYPEAAEAYRALARLALGFARRAGLGADAAATVRDAID